MSDRATMTLVTDGLHFPEGPVALRDGRVRRRRDPTGTITAVAPDGTKEVRGRDRRRAERRGDRARRQALRLQQRRLRVARRRRRRRSRATQPDDYIGGRIQRVDLDTGEVEDLYTECDGIRLRGPNDLVFDAHGGFWFTDHGKSPRARSDRGGVYYAQADGSSITEVVFPLDHAERHRPVAGRHEASTSPRR